ncbi:MAG: tetratricopeptide repeat protein, partial [Planctomycetaceae bacterium]|nr:tetratricopeptide repeat protein [Planctomycetaceae bacterium]
MRENENWKDYLIPGCLAAGLLVLMVSVAVFGRQGFERAGSFTTEDVFVGLITSSDESVDLVIVPTKATDLVKKPENMDDPIEFDKWNDNQYLKSFSNRLSSTRIDDVPKLLEEVSEIRESDGAIYYYALGYIYDQMMRSSPAVNARDAQYAKAVENYDKAVELNGKNAFFVHFRGQADYYYAEKSGRKEFYSTALPYYLKAEQLATNWSRPVDLQGWCAYHLGNNNEALALFERAAKIDPNDSDVQAGLSRARAALAQEDANRVNTGSSQTVTRPENRNDPVEFDKWYPNLLSFPAKIDSNNIEDLTQLLEEHSDIRESDGAIYYYVLASIYDRFTMGGYDGQDIRAQLFAKAIENYDKAIELSGDNAVFYYRRGNVRAVYNFRRPELYSTAYSDFVKAEQLAPNWLEPVIAQGQTAYNLGKYREALVLYERVAEIDPANAGVINRLPQIRDKLELWHDMIDHDAPLDFTGEVATRWIKKPETTDSRELDRWNGAFHEVVASAGSRSPEEVPELVTRWTDLTEKDGKFYHYVCGYVHDRMSRDWKESRLSHVTQAVKHYTKAIELDGDAAVFYHFRGQVRYFYALHENAPEYYEKAFEDYVIAERCDPAWPMPVCLQGWVMFRLDRFDEAVSFFERALEIDNECHDALIGMVYLIDKKSERDPKNMDLLKQGLDLIERWHKIIVTKKNQDRLENGTWFAMKFIARWKDMETVTPQSHPKFFRRAELENKFITAKPSEEALALYDWLMYGEISPYYYYEMRTPETIFSSENSKSRVYYQHANIHFSLGNFEKAVASAKFFMETAINNDYRPRYSNDPDIHAIYIRSLYRLGRYDEIIDYYTSDKLTQEQLKTSMRSPNPHFVDIALAMSKTGQTEWMLEFVALLDWSSITYMLSNNAQYLSWVTDPEIREFCTLYAEALCQKAVEEDVDHAQNQPLSTMGRLNTLLNNAIRYDSSFHPFFKRIGDIFFDRSQYQFAANHYERYLKFVPLDSEVLDRLMQSYEHIPNVREAFRVATLLIMLQPENPEFWIKRGRLQYKSSNLGNISDASLWINDLTRATELMERGDQTDKKRLAQVYFWQGDVMKSIELTAGTPIDQVTFENTKGDKTVFAYKELLWQLLQPRVYPLKIEKPISELCTDFIRQGGDELFLIAVRAEAYQR